MCYERICPKKLDFSKKICYKNSEFFVPQKLSGQFDDHKITKINNIKFCNPDQHFFSLVTLQNLAEQWRDDMKNVPLVQN